MYNSIYKLSKAFYKKTLTKKAALDAPPVMVEEANKLLKQYVLAYDAEDYLATYINEFNDKKEFRTSYDGVDIVPIIKVVVDKTFDNTIRAIKNKVWYHLNIYDLYKDELASDQEEYDHYIKSGLSKEDVDDMDLFYDSNRTKEDIENRKSAPVEFINVKESFNESAKRNIKQETSKLKDDTLGSYGIKQIERMVLEEVNSILSKVLKGESITTIQEVGDRFEFRGDIFSGTYEKDELKSISDNLEESITEYGYGFGTIKEYTEDLIEKHQRINDKIEKANSFDKVREGRVLDELNVDIDIDLSNWTGLRILKRLDSSIPDDQLAERAKEIFKEHKGYDFVALKVVPYSDFRKTRIGDYNMTEGNFPEVRLFLSEPLIDGPIKNFSDIYESKFDYDTDDAFDSIEEGYDFSFFTESTTKGMYPTLVHEFGHFAQDVLAAFMLEYGKKDRHGNPVVPGLGTYVNPEESKMYDPFGNYRDQQLKDEWREHNPDDEPQEHRNRRIETHTRAISAVERYLEQMDGFNPVSPQEFITRTLNLDPQGNLTPEDRQAVQTFFRLLQQRQTQ